MSKMKPDIPSKSRLKCIWCMSRTATNPCEHCGSDQVYDMDVPHTCHWSRKAMDTVECKICERTMSMEEYLKHAAP